MGGGADRPCRLKIAHNSPAVVYSHACLDPHKVLVWKTGKPIVNFPKSAVNHGGTKAVHLGACPAHGGKETPDTEQT